MHGWMDGTFFCSFPATFAYQVQYRIAAIVIEDLIIFPHIQEKKQHSSVLGQDQKINEQHPCKKRDWVGWSVDETTGKTLKTH